MPITRNIISNNLIDGIKPSVQIVNNKIYLFVQRNYRQQVYIYDKLHVNSITSIGSELSPEDKINLYDLLSFLPTSFLDSFENRMFPDVILERQPDVTINTTTFVVTYNKNIPSNIPQIKLYMYVSENVNNVELTGPQTYTFSTISPQINISDLFPENKTVQFVGSITFYEELSFNNITYKSLIKEIKNITYTNFSDTLITNPQAISSKFDSIVSYNSFTNVLDLETISLQASSFNEHSELINVVSYNSFTENLDTKLTETENVIILNTKAITTDYDDLNIVSYNSYTIQ